MEKTYADNKTHADERSRALNRLKIVKPLIHTPEAMKIRKQFEDYSPLMQAVITG